MSMGGGGGKGGNSGPNGQDMLGSTISALSAETMPIRQTLSSQFQEALNTGGIGAQIPLISAMQSESRRATSNAQRATTGDLAASGLSRTPFGQQILAGGRQQGEMATSMIPSSVAQGFIGAAPSYAMAPVGAMISGAGSLSNTQAYRDVSKGQQQTDLFTGMMKAAASASAACWVARRLYGRRSSKALLARWWMLRRGPVWLRRVYLRYGERVAATWWVPALRPLFDLAVAWERRA